MWQLPPFMGQAKEKTTNLLPGPVLRDERRLRHDANTKHHSRLVAGILRIGNLDFSPQCELETSSQTSICPPLHLEREGCPNYLSFLSRSSVNQVIGIEFKLVQVIRGYVAPDLRQGVLVSHSAATIFSTSPSDKPDALNSSRTSNNLPSRRDKLRAVHL